MRLVGDDPDRLIDEAIDRHPSRANWRARTTDGSFVALADHRRLRAPRRNITLGMHPDEIGLVWAAAADDGVTTCTWLRRLIVTELRRRGVPDQRMAWLAAASLIPDMRLDPVSRDLLPRREYWL